MPSEQSEHIARRPGACWSDRTLDGVPVVARVLHTTAGVGTTFIFLVFKEEHVPGSEVILQMLQ